VLSVKPLFKRFQQYEKPLYDMKDRSLKANWYEISRFACINFICLGFFEISHNAGGMLSANRFN